MKKYFLLLLAALMLLMTAGIALAEVNASFIPPESGENMTVEKDMGLLINKTWYPILTDIQSLHEALGDHTVMNAAPSCVFVGEDKEFVYEGMSIFTNPVGEKDIWFELYMTDNTYATSRGIRVGDTLYMLQKVYGSRCYWEGDTTLTYSVSGIEGDYVSPCIMFEVVDDIIVSIDVYYPTNVIEPIV